MCSHKRADATQEVKEQLVRTHRMDPLFQKWHTHQALRIEDVHQILHPL